MLTLTGCETVEVEEKAPPTSDLSVPSALRAAQQVKIAGQDRFLAVTEGSSMRPLYQDDTVIVYAPIAFEDLEPEMIVAYRQKSDGRVITHQLVRPRRRGWEVRGTNNPVSDLELVTPENLIGVVYTVIYTGSDK